MEPFVPPLLYASLIVVIVAPSSAEVQRPLDRSVKLIHPRLSSSSS